MLPSTLDMVPLPSTWNPRPSTLDKKIDSPGFARFAKNKVAVNEIRSRNQSKRLLKKNITLNKVSTDYELIFRCLIIISDTPF